MVSSLARAYPVLALCGGYVLMMLFNPVRQALGDGFRCIGRYKRIWISFALLGFGYFVFQFATFTPIRNWADLDPSQIISLPHWYWPGFTEVWRETPLPALEGVAGIFDNATTTYPLSVVAAVFLLANWRGLHGALLRALWKRYRFWGHLTYIILLMSSLASLLNQFVFWQLLAMSILIIAFCSVLISLALHNETVLEAMRAHSLFIRRNAVRLGWFLVICGIHFFCIMVCDAIVRSAIADRLGALFLWKLSFAFLRGVITGWLLASWVCLFRQCETGRITGEKWIQY